MAESKRLEVEVHGHAADREALEKMKELVEVHEAKRGKSGYTSAVRPLLDSLADHFEKEDAWQKSRIGS